MAAVCGLLAMAASGTAYAQQVDHAAFDQLLRSRVNAQGIVGYDAFARSSAFAGYLEQLARTDPRSLPDADRLAFWINAYNAYTIALINRHGERRSIRNINRTLGFMKGKGPWSEPTTMIGGRSTRWIRSSTRLFGSSSTSRHSLCAGLCGDWLSTAATAGV